MEAVEDSEVLVRFQLNEVGNDQRLRLWLQADAFGSGSTMPVNGYGIELNLQTDKLMLRGRKDNSSINFKSKDVKMTTDWHWLRLRAQEDQLMVRLWDEGEEEPTEWDIVHTLSQDEQLEDRRGKMLLGVINFDYASGNTFHFDKIIVNDLSR